MIDPVFDCMAIHVQLNRYIQCNGTMNLRGCYITKALVFCIFMVDITQRMSARPLHWINNTQSDRLLHVFDSFKVMDVIIYIYNSGLLRRGG